MEITEVRVKLMEEAGERLQAFCSITLDDAFVVRDLKIIEGATGPFVAMPSRKLTTHCPQCGCKNHLRAAFCNQCGVRQRDQQASKDDEGRAKLYADIAHPINSHCREMIQQRVIQAYEEEKARSKLPGYVPSYDDFDEDPTWMPAPTAGFRRGAEGPGGREAPRPASPARRAAAHPPTRRNARQRQLRRRNLRVTISFPRSAWERTAWPLRGPVAGTRSVVTGSTIRHDFAAGANASCRRGKIGSAAGPATGSRRRSPREALLGCSI